MSFIDDYLNYQLQQSELDSLNLQRISEIESERLSEEEMGEDEDS